MPQTTNKINDQLIYFSDDGWGMDIGQYGTRTFCSHLHITRSLKSNQTRLPGPCFNTST